MKTVFAYAECNREPILVSVRANSQRRVESHFERVVLAAEFRGFHTKRRCHEEKLSAADRPGTGSETTS